MERDHNISNSAATKPQVFERRDDDIALLKARIAELEAEIDDLEIEVNDLETELEIAPDPDLLTDIRRDLEQGDVEYALIRIGRAIGW